jgi:hypothetical protein
MTHTAPVRKKRLLGECVPTLQSFANLEESLLKFRAANFRSLSSRKKFVRISKALLQLIQAHSTPCFLLGAVLQFIDRVNEEKLADEPYSLTGFELWLNHFSTLSMDEILAVRGKIVGRLVPRDEYQVFFPVGMGKTYQGSHFVAAHLSPDVDTTISSFWGWVDAFGCRVAEGTHQWSLPPGLSDGHIRLFFDGLFGKNLFERLSRSTPAMTINAGDLLTKREFHRVLESARGDSVDHSRTEHAVIIVDEEGYYKGEWRSGDAEDVRQVISGLTHALRWFEGQCHAGMIRVLAHEEATTDRVVSSYERLLKIEVNDCPAVKELSERARRLFHEYLKRVIGLQKGSHHTFHDLLLQLDMTFSTSFGSFFAKCKGLTSPELFTSQGHMKADRAEAAKAVEAVVEAMERALQTALDQMEKLSHLLEVKRTVLGYPPTFVMLKSDVEEMRTKMGHFDHLTVVIPEGEGQWYPVGVVYADDLRKNILGTVSFRDFSSPEETKMASYIEVISIVDHHKLRLQTSTPPTLVIGDVQSSNTLMAEQSLRINAQYGKDEGTFFIDSRRELCECFMYIFGILDDTDLLSKVSRRDIFSLRNILHRMRTIVDGEESAKISFEHIAEDKDFVRNAAKALLRNEDLHSIYVNVYRFREKEVEEALAAAAQGLKSNLFMDTKEQNGCCRVGQIKLFYNNIRTYQAHRQELITLWQREAEAVFADRSQVDFFLQMVSTVLSEKEVFRGEESGWDHKDEIWIWSPEGSVPEQHLIAFLNNFDTSSAARSLPIEVEIIGSQAEKRKSLFAQNFPRARHVKVQTTVYGPTIAFLRYPAGAINSRKSQVSPFLPKLLS